MKENNPPVSRAGPQGDLPGRPQGAVVIQLRPSKIGPLLTFRYIMFMLAFLCSFVMLIGGGVAVFTNTTESTAASADDIVYNIAVFSAGFVGVVLSGIGWTLSIIAERLANKGII